MRKSGLQHARLSAIVAGMGHGDLLVIADVGLPVPPGVECVDLAVTAGVPRFLDVLAAVAGELAVERCIVADELLAGDPGTELPARIDALLAVPRESVPHAEFKERTRRATAVVRTGEVTPYANVILVAGVAF